METKKTDHRRVSITAARKPVEPIVLQKSEWLWLQDKLTKDQGKVRKLPVATRDRLLKVTNIYASSCRDLKLSTESLKTICKEIADWRVETARLRNIIWKKPTDFTAREKSRRSILIHAIKNKEVDLDDIIDKHFNRDPSKIETFYPLARFDRLLNGAIATSDFTVEKLFQEAEFSREAKLWFLWAAVVFAILCKAHIPVKHPKRDQLLNGPLKVLEKLQSKLPAELQRRQTQNSLRKGAVNAYKIRFQNNIDLMQRYLMRWATGNLEVRANSETKNKFFKRFNSQIARATKPQSKRMQTA